MENINPLLTRILKKSFPGAELELEPSGGERIGGFLIWNGFQGQDHIKRQRRLWKILREKLTQKQQLAISAILTMTPEEMASAREE